MTTIPVSSVRSRKVDPEWSCQKSGDCCRMPESVIMTDAEAAIIEERAQKVLTIVQLNKLEFTPHSMGFVSLKAHPCPLLDMSSGTPVCTVYDVRPYNCRRFACFRPDPAIEPLIITPPSPVLQYGNVGCANLRERLLESRVARRLFEKIQRKAQRWARLHGWKD